MSEDCDKNSLQFPRAQSDILQLLLLPNQLPKTQIIPLPRKCQGKAANPYITEAGTSSFLTCLPEDYWND